PAAFGDVVAVEPAGFRRHAPLVAELRFGKRSRQGEVRVALEVVYTELGTLELWIVAPETGHRGRLSFQLRSGGRRGASGAGAPRRGGRPGSSGGGRAAREAFVRRPGHRRSGNARHADGAARGSARLREAGVVARRRAPDRRRAAREGRRAAAIGPARGPL